MLSPFYESDMCYSAEVLFKTAIKGQKTISIPHQYRYGLCKNSFKTISIPWRYWYGFFGNFALKVVFLWSISHQSVTPCALVIIDILHPEQIWGLTWKLEEEKIEKTISIPAWYRYGFLEILLKPTPTGMLCNDMSQICVPLQKFFQKQPKTTKNHIYTTLV